MRIAQLLQTFTFATTLAIGFGSCAFAGSPWVIDTASSDVGFEYLKDGVPTKGEFGAFSGSGTFDAQSPESARFQIQIRTESIDLYDTMASAFATSAEWFDSKNHPNVEYTLLSLSPAGDGLFNARGLITIRGKQQPLSSTVRLSIEDATAEATGTLDITRSDFLLGVGPSAAFVEIGPVVNVSFRLVAAPAR